MNNGPTSPQQQICQRVSLIDEDLMNQVRITMNWFNVIVIERCSLKRKTLFDQIRRRYVLIYINFKLVQIPKVLHYIQFFFPFLSFLRCSLHVKESFPFYTPSPFPILTFHLLIKQLIFQMLVKAGLTTLEALSENFK